VTSSANGLAAVKRIKFSTRPAPSLRLKSKGEPPVRPKGVGYDSEASDTEVDPALEEQFILRMQPGEDCDYLRQAVEEKRFGPRSQGGADVSFKSLTRDGRRAAVTIRGRIYAASLVDLPCIVEGLKSWDKRGWYKAADICQMLLVRG
jgi:transcription initiation factor TFIID subunit 7